MDDFYRENILDHYKHPRNFGRLLNGSDAVFELANPLCGDKIGMGIKVSAKGRSSFGRKVVEEIRFFGEGCAISTAAASMLTEKVKGMEIEEVQKIDTKEILKLLGIKLTPIRLKCALLPLEALKKTLARLTALKVNPKANRRISSCQRGLIIL